MAYVITDDCLYAVLVQTTAPLVLSVKAKTSM